MYYIMKKTLTWTRPIKQKISEIFLQNDPSPFPIVFHSMLRAQNYSYSKQHNSLWRKDLHQCAFSLACANFYCITKIRRVTG